MADFAKDLLPPLLRLPSELVHEIIRHAMPESFENLLLTCQALYVAGQPLAPLYQERKRLWSTLAIDKTDRRGLLVCLNRIAREPEVLRYVLTANLDLIVPKACPPTLEFRQSPAYREYAQIRASEDDINHIRAFLERSPALRQPGLDARAWSNGILGPILNFAENECDCSFESKRSQLYFLSLLKNIRTLSLVVDQLHPLHGAEPDFPLMLSSIKSLQALQPLDAPLAQLRTLLCFHPLGFTSWGHFGALGFFLTSPSLTKLCATSYLAVGDRYNTIFSWPASMPFHQKLRTIELLDCCFDEYGLEQLLAGTPSLETFKFGYAMKHSGGGNDFNPARFVRALGKYVSRPLKHLALSIEPTFYGTIENGVVSMNEFSALETLEMDFRFFYGPSLESGEVNGTKATLPLKGLPVWDPSATPALKDIVPPTLKRMELFLGDSMVAGSGQRYNQDASLRALFGLLENEAESTAPHKVPIREPPAFMSNCTIRCVSDTLSMSTNRFGQRVRDLESDALKERLQDMGVVCHLNSAEDPEWARQFKRQYGIKSAW